MKKIVVILAILLLVGCGEKSPKPVKDTVDHIVESKESTVKIQVINILKEAETKWMMGIEQTCISASELVSGRDAKGDVCINEEYIVYAKDISYQNYTCNGTKDSLSCVGEEND